ncbi:MAG: nucleoside deaminase [Acidobacteriota bacterium]
MAHLPKEEFMRLAITEAEGARQAGDYAIGAVIVRDEKILASSGNRIRQGCDPTQHAEIVAIRLACARAGSSHIDGAILYTTAEPCPMCAAAAIWARMGGIVSGSTIDDMAQFRAKLGNSQWSWRTVDLAARTVLEQGHPRLFLVEGFLREECVRLFHS